mmetsp:Transcript_16787/g.27913  ORF Transcript_16787/g.27913 Transcript_16787/m.27913 type:complete len:202 (-) Transcript_16787:16-621(-)
MRQRPKRIPVWPAMRHCSVRFERMPDPPPPAKPQLALRPCDRRASTGSHSAPSSVASAHPDWTIAVLQWSGSRHQSTVRRWNLLHTRHFQLCSVTEFRACKLPCRPARCLSSKQMIETPAWTCREHLVDRTLRRLRCRSFVGTKYSLKAARTERHMLFSILPRIPMLREIILAHWRQSQTWLLPWARVFVFSCASKPSFLA